MPTSPLQAFPYPSLTDPANGPVAFQNLAQAVEKRVVMVFATAAARDAAVTAPTEGMTAWLQDTTSLVSYNGTGWVTLWSDSGWVTTGFTAGSGFSISNTRYRIVGGLCEVRVTLIRTGTTITATAAGNIVGEPALVTIPSAAWPTGHAVYPTFGVSGVFQGQASLSTSGVIALTCMTPSATIDSTTNTTVLVSIAYFLG